MLDATSQDEEHRMPLCSYLSCFTIFYFVFRSLCYMSFYKTFLFFFFGILLFCCFFAPFCDTNSSPSILASTSGFLWPTPGYTTITSPFGKRSSPTAGASSYHKGVDIAAAEGSDILAITDGIISFAGFLGGGGYTLTLTASPFQISYCHLSPIYLVEEGMQVHKGQVIARVGPKYVYGVPGNRYTDSSGRPTNGATTGVHLHLGFRLDGDYVNPMEYLPNLS